MKNSNYLKIFHLLCILKTTHWSRLKREKTDQEAVMILVELIKHPGIGIKQLSARVAKQGQWVEPEAIRAFLQMHDLVKKTSDTRR